MDLDATAELPIIELDDAGTLAVESLPESAIATDVFAPQVIPAGVADLADSLREVEHRLERKIERVSALESELAAARQQIESLRTELTDANSSAADREGTLRAELATASQRNADLHAEIAASRSSLGEVRAQLQLQHAALTESQQQSQQRAGQQRDLERDLRELQRRAARQHEALSTWQGYRAFSESLLAQSEAQLQGVDAQHAAALQEVRNDCSRLREELAEARQSAAAEVAALRQSLQVSGEEQQTRAAELAVAAERASQLVTELAASQAAHAATMQQLDALRSLEDKARLGAEQFDEHQRRIAELQAQLGASAERERELDAQLHKMTERVRRLEGEAHASAAVLGNLQLNMQRLGRDDTGSRPALPAVSVLRVLIRNDGGSEVVYPLTRRTTIGRTPDNDIQVDASWVSRHHAVLLSGPDHCIVEDLHSTNGVLVNGRRVGRQILQDGDTVTVGKTEFRYQQRS